MKKNFNRIDELIGALTHGEMVVLLDDERRENEGDIIMLAEKITPAAINFMASYARGLICLAMTTKVCHRLRLPLMVSTIDNTTMHRTNFTVSIDAKKGISTGISAADRAHTIKTAANPRSRAAEFVRPGHIFPLMAQEGGVLSRAGHTEAATDLASLANCQPLATLVEIMNPDGSMARAPQLYRLAKKHRLKISTIAELVSFRLKNENLLRKISQKSTLSSPWGDFHSIAYSDKINKTKYLAFIKKSQDRRHIVYIDQLSMARDLITDKKHKWNLSKAMEKVSQYGGAVLIVDADHISMAPQPTAAEPLSLRHIALCAQILHDVNMTSIELLNNRTIAKRLSSFRINLDSHST